MAQQFGNENAFYYSFQPMKFSSFVHILLPNNPEFAELLIQRPERYMRDLNAQEAALKNAPVNETKNVSDVNCMFKLEDFF